MGKVFEKLNIVNLCRFIKIDYEKLIKNTNKFYNKRKNLCLTEKALLQPKENLRLFGGRFK